MSPNEPGTPALAPPRSPWLTAFVLMSAVFIFGGLVGASATLAIIWNQTPRVFGPGDFPAERMVGAMRRELELSPEQAAELQTVVDAHREQMTAIHSEVRPRVEAQLETFREDVDAVLTPEQAETWNARFNREWERWMPSGPGGGRHGRGGRGAVKRVGGFRVLDGDGDGAATLAEVQSVVPDLTEKTFDELDTNDDGALDPEEWRDGAPSEYGGPGERGGSGPRGGGPGHGGWNR